MLLITSLSACGAKNEKPKADLHNTTIENSDQSAAVKAKKIIAAHKETTAIHAVSSKEKLIAAFEIQHVKRFGLEKLKTKIGKQLKEAFPNKEIEVSTDQKLIIETEKLEKSIRSQKIDTKKQLNKQIDKLIQLSREKT